MRYVAFTPAPLPSSMLMLLPADARPSISTRERVMMPPSRQFAGRLAPGLLRFLHDADARRPPRSAADAIILRCMRAKAVAQAGKACVEDAREPSADAQAPSSFPPPSKRAASALAFARCRRADHQQRAHSAPQRLIPPRYRTTTARRASRQRRTPQPL